MSSLDSKKGQIDNYLVGIIAIFIFGFTSILSMLIYSEIRTGFINASMYTGALATTGDAFFSGFQVLDYVIVILVLVIIIGVGVTSFKINTPPAFFMVTLVLGGILAFVSFILSYTFAQMTAPTIFNSVLLYFPRTLTVCTNLHWVALILIVVGSITLYAKKEKGDF